MVEAIVFEWKMVLLPAAVFLYIEFLKRLNYKYAARHTPTDEEVLALIARSRSISEYDVFHVAAKTWHIGKTRVEEDFNRYVTEGPIPHYVRDYVRKVREEAGNLYMPNTFGGYPLR